MRAVEARDFSIDALKLAQSPVPEVRRGEILVKISAASLNYRDLAILVQKYMPNLKLPYVPASDCCGEVVEVGEDVKRFREGDRVVPVYTQGWHDGKPTPLQRTTRTLGAPLTGVLQEYVAVPEEEAVAAPANLSDADLSGTDLNGAVLFGADLKRALMKRTFLERADLRQADLSTAEFDPAILEGTALCGTLLPTGIDDSGCR